LAGADGYKFFMSFARLPLSPDMVEAFFIIASMMIVLLD
jgi:hypothetical protein